MANILITEAEEQSLEEYLEDSWKDEGDLDDGEKKIFDNNYKFYRGSVSDQDEAIEAALCHIGLDYEDEEIIIKKEDSY